MPDGRPNVVLIVTHDTGRQLGCYGRPVQTPHLDQVAVQGIRFAGHFSVAAQCSPSRAALMTGRWPHCNGMMGLAPRWGYRQGERTLAHHLAAAGYETVLFGLQHEGVDPRLLGYGTSYTELAANGFRYRDGAVSPGMVLADQASAWIRQRQGGRRRPYLLVLGLAETHRPWDRPEYGDAGPDEAVAGSVPPYLPDDPRVRDELARFHAAVRFADRVVGEVRSAVDSGPEVDRTLLLFTVDHGVAFPRAKGMSYDPGLESALVVRWPDRVAAGQVRGELLCNLDVLPTLLEAVGIPVPSEVQGRSFLGLLTGGPYTPRSDIRFGMTWHDDYNPHRGIRTSHHKYIRNFGDLPRVFLPADIARSPSGAAVRDLWPEGERPAEELYALDTDPWEQCNRAADPACAALLEDLRGRVDRWMAATGDPLRDGPVALPPAVR